jgi:hypothetical protein
MGLAKSVDKSELLPIGRDHDCVFSLHFRGSGRAVPWNPLTTRRELRDSLVARYYAMLKNATE